MSKEKKLGQENLFKSMVTLSLPAIITVVLAQSAYIVDSLFVALYDIDSLAIVTLSQPVILVGIMIAFSIIAGIAPLISRKLGEKEYDKTRKYFMSALYLTIGLTLIYIIIFFIFNESILTNILAIQPDMITDSKKYIFPILISQLFYTSVIIMEQSAVAQGNNFRIMVVNLISVTINIILNYIFLTQTNMGLLGVGLATLVATLFKLGIYVKFYSNKDQIVHFTKGYLFDNEFFTSLLTSALAAFGMSLATLMGVIINNYSISVLALNPTPYLIIKSMVNILFSFCTSFMIGIMQTTQAFISFNFGAENYVRMRNSAIIGILFSLSLAFLLSIGILHIKDDLSNIFNQNNLEHAFNIAIYSTIIALFAMPTTFLVTSLSRSIKSNKVLFYHQWITNGLVLLSLSIILPLFFSIDYVVSFRSISQIIMLIFVIPSYIILFHKIHKLIVSQKEI